MQEKTKSVITRFFCLPQTLVTDVWAKKWLVALFDAQLFS